MIGLVFSLAFTMVSLMFQAMVWTMRIMVMMLALVFQMIGSASSHRRR